MSSTLVAPFYFRRALFRASSERARPLGKRWPDHTPLFPSQLVASRGIL